LLQLYFKKVRVEGLKNIPRNKAILVVPNHQNAFLDPILVASFLPLPLHFLTRSDVFTRWTNSIFKKVNMIPIFRIRDGIKNLARNSVTFDICTELFQRKQSVLIFPEGNHGEYHYLRPLSKGASRIALNAQLAMKEDLYVLPVGLNYFDHLSPRSTVLLVIGKPIKVGDYLSLYESNPAKGLTALKQEMTLGMKNTLVIPEKNEEYEMKAKAIFSTGNEKLSFDQLKQFDISSDIKSDFRRSHLIAKILNPVPYAFIHSILKKFDDIVFHSSLKFAMGIFIFPIWWIVIFLISFYFFGIQIALLGLVVMVTGLFYSYQ